MRACPVCGSSNGATDDFCGNCGAYLGWSGSAPARSPAAPEAGAPGPADDARPAAESAPAPATTGSAPPAPAAAGSAPSSPGRAGPAPAAPSRAESAPSAAPAAEPAAAPAESGSARPAPSGAESALPTTADADRQHVRRPAAPAGAEPDPAAPAAADRRLPWQRRRSAPPAPGAAAGSGPPAAPGAEPARSTPAAADRPGPDSAAPAVAESGPAGPAAAEPAAAAAPAAAAPAPPEGREDGSGRGASAPTSVPPTPPAPPAPPAPPTPPARPPAAPTAARPPAAPRAVAPQAPASPQPVRPAKAARPRPVVRTAAVSDDVSGVPCPACGTPNPPDRRFCRRCAAPLTPTTAPAPLPWWRTVWPFRRRTRAGSGRAPRFLVVLAVVLALCAGGFLLLPAGRHLIEDTRDKLGKAKAVTATRVEASAEVPGHPVGDSTDGLSNRYWGAPGPGASVTYTFAKPFRLVAVIITNGASSAPEEYARQARALQIDMEVTSKDGRKIHKKLALSDKPGPQTFPTGISDVTTVRLTLDAPAGAAPERHLALAEVEFFQRS
ncbi:NADase-type glycan-binding domain-containing protein [Streptomyces avidinii]|uniref:NADase-type glycan-binding domain-containing protein n=1 Tax=Streptomyces avidinii TaxID=1895 RepID=UPI0037ACEAE2